MRKWIDTEFGYYALCPEPYLAEWAGTEANGAEADYVGRVAVPGHGEVLTLGGEPSTVTYLDGTRTFARWYGADSDTGLEVAVERSMASEDWEDAFGIDLGGRYLLLDTFALGSEVGSADTLRIDLPKGHYRVQSLMLETPEGWFLLERLLAE